MQQDEELLIEQARQGDKKALAQLVEGHLQRLYRVALRMCGNVADAEETLQETFLSAIKALPHFEGRSQFATWLYRIASNACLMHRRRLAAEPVVLSIEDGEEVGRYLPHMLADGAAQPADVALNHELQETVRAAMAALPPALRIVFLWRELEGLSTAETAAILGISESAVKVRLHRARKQLRDSISDYLAGPEPEPTSPGHLDQDLKVL